MMICFAVAAAAEVEYLDFLPDNRDMFVEHFSYREVMAAIL
jgi:hypothetical protein